MNGLTQLLYTIVPWLLGLSAFATVVALLATIKHALDMRRASFFILRQRSRRKFRNSLAMTMLFTVLTAGILFSPQPRPETGDDVAHPAATDSISPTPVRAVNSASIPRVTMRPTMTPTAAQSQALSPTAPFIPTNTPTYSPTPTPSSTTTPSVTPTPTITPTPSPTVPVLEAILTPVTPFATLAAPAELSELTVSAGIQLSGSPIDPGTEFEEGRKALYVAFDYDRMANGLLWRHIWFRDGALIGGETRIWEWGRRGRTYFFLRPTGGFPAGQYEVRLLVDDEVVQTARFTVINQ